MMSEIKNPDSSKLVVYSRGKITHTFEEITFNSNFDSGNLDKVEFVNSKESEQVEFQLWTAPDCAGTVYENGNRSWFYFNVITSANYIGKTIKLHIRNLNRQSKLYQQGLTPLMKTLPGRNVWERMKDKPEWQITENGMILSFHFTPPELRKTTTSFSFCYPLSYTDCQRYLTKIENKIQKRKQSGEGYDIYYHRDLLCHSLDGLRVDLITVTSFDGMSSTTESDIVGLFPDKESDRSYQFNKKKVVLITSRVHPGETPASFVFNGILEFLLREDDPRSQALRRHFLFKLIPIINPDGVQRGHYRTDSRGVNLNRVYLNPEKDIHPSVYAIRQLMLYYHSGTLSTGLANEDQIDDILQQGAISRVALYVDLHAHATKRGCFMYGNHFHSVEDHMECMLLPKLVSLNSAHFEFNQCVFSERNMYAADKRDEGITKEGSGRVALYKATGLIHCYTLECNYNSGTRVNQVTQATMDSGKCSPPIDGSPIPHRLTLHDYEEVGRGLAVAILDLHGLNPCSRLLSTQYTTLSGVKQFLRQKIENDRMRLEMRKQERKQQANSVTDVVDHKNTSKKSDQGSEPDTVTQKKTEMRYKLSLYSQPHILISRKPIVSSVSDSLVIEKESIPFSSFKFPLGPSNNHTAQSTLPLVKTSQPKGPRSNFMHSFSTGSPTARYTGFTIVGKNISGGLYSKSVIINRPTATTSKPTQRVISAKKRQVSLEAISQRGSTSRLPSSFKTRQKALAKTSHVSTKGSCKPNRSGTTTYPIFKMVTTKKSPKILPMK